MQMNQFIGKLNRVLAIAVVLGLPSHRAAAAPLTEEDLATLLKVELEEDVVVSKIRSEGVSFQPTDAALKKLEAVGASKGVLEAVRAAGPAPDPGKPGGVVTYDDVRKLLDLKIPEEAILKRLEASPTLFTLDAEQIEELKSKGASDRLLEAMQGRSPGKPAVEISDVALILDCSGSMEEATEDGRTKMQVARTVMTDLVRGVPEGLHATFLVYGHDRARGCKAVEVVRPLSELDDAGKDALAAYIAKVPAVGNTLIALALEAAGKELAKTDGHCGVVLVTDGKEGCKGDPAAVARKLAENSKLSFGVNVVGFGLTDEETEAVQEIAEAGKGKYYDARTPGELTEALANVSFRLRAAAKPAPKSTTNRRAFIVLASKVSLPPMAEIYYVPAGTPMAIVGTAKKGGTTKYGEEVRLPSAEKFDVIWVPEEGLPIQLLKDFSIPDRRVVEIRPDERVGVVQVNEGKDIVVVKEDTPAAIFGTGAVQRAKKAGDLMVVPAGKYDIYVDGDVIEESFEVAPGQLHEL